MKREAVQRIFSHLPTLTTSRLILRPMRVEDCFDMYAYAKRADVTRYLTWSPHLNMEYTKEYLKYIKRHYRMGDFYDWAVVVADEDKMIGTCGFTRFYFEHDAAEVGYVLNPDHHGRGYATEALQRILSFGFDNLALNRIEAKYIVGNDASRRVMEKCGMRFEGIRRSEMLVKGVYRDVGVCSILRSDLEKEE